MCACVCVCVHVCVFILPGFLIGLPQADTSTSGGARKGK